MVEVLVEAGVVVAAELFELAAVEEEAVQRQSSFRLTKHLSGEAPLQRHSSMPLSVHWQTPRLSIWPF